MQHSSSETLSPPTTADGKTPVTFPPNTSHGGTENDVEKDIEKGDPGPQDHNEADHGDMDRGQTKEESNLIGWDGPNDPENPQNWSKSKKYTVTIFYSSMTFCLTFASSIFSTATHVTAKLYGVSDEVMVLGTSLFVLV